MISVKKKKYDFSKKKWKEIVFVNFVLKIVKVLSEESCRGVGVAMCCSLNFYQHFFHQMTGIFRHEFWKKSFKERSVHMLDIPRRPHQERNCNCAKIVMLQKKDVCKIAWYKIMGIFRSTYMSYKHENERGCKILPHQNKGTQK